MEQNEFETTNFILNSIMNMDSSEEKHYDTSLVTAFGEALPKETTINKIFKECPDIKNTLEELIEIISLHVNSKKLYNNLINMLKNLTTNTEFDYFKEVVSNE